MAESITRKTGESNNQLSIHAQRFKELHKLGEKTGLPLTILVDRALEGYLADGKNFNALKTQLAVYSDLMMLCVWIIWKNERF